MAAGKLKDSTNIAETDDELAELVEDEIEHDATVRVICRLKCAVVPVDEQCAELEVVVDNCKYETINLEKYKRVSRPGLR